MRLRKEALEVKDFTEDRAVADKVEELKAQMLERLRKEQWISDLIDDKGNQYVDLVMEGGGTLGLALLGYVYALEQAGIRFLDIGGTSAGAITALLLAAVNKPKDQPKSEELLRLLATQNIGEFVDGRRGVRKFINGWLANRPKFLLLALHGRGVLRAIFDNLGLNPGQVFLDWVKTSLAENKIGTVAELNARLAALPEGFHHRLGKELSEQDRQCKLALVAAEVTTESKIQFPEHAPLFWDDWAQQSPSLFVRASMSVPFFFTPLPVSLPDNKKVLDRWKDIGVEDIPPGHQCQLIDGGIMSNFPINLFHQDGVPSAPTFGVRLNRRKTRTIRTLSELGTAIFDSARHCLDFDFILRHSDYSQLIAWVDRKDHKWLDFEMSREDQVELFRCGVDAAAGFLENFDWEKYKEGRTRPQSCQH